MKALIIGASGQIGGFLSAECAARGIEAAGAGVGGEPLKLDLAAPATIGAAFGAVKPGLVFLCSAMTWVDGCEKDAVAARRVNTEGPAAVAGECRKLGARLVYLSTEYVFDGTAGPYSETDPVCPISVYGHTKLEGELAVLAGADSLSARTTVVYSYAPGGMNFIMQLVAAARAGKKMLVPKDQISNPTHAPDLARALLDLALAGAGGVINVVGPEVMDRYEFALRACRAFNLDPAFLEPRLTSELGQIAPRPLKAGLKTDKLLKTLGRGLPPVDESLAYIASKL
jgi:dTDP-4-dehydrorhamnose reductase